MAALPPSFLKPGTSFGVILSISTSVVQCRAGVYISQKAVLAVTGSGGPPEAGTFVSACTEGLLTCEQPASNRAATATALTTYCLIRAPIAILHSSGRDAGTGFAEMMHSDERAVRHSATA